MLTNARSLSPKIHSLIDLFEELELDLSIITESWLADSERLAEDVIDLEYGTDLCILYKNRPLKPNSRRRTAGGGVAVVYNKTSANFKEIKIPGNRFELVCVKGKIQNIENQIMVLGIYVEPKTLAADFAELRDLVSEVITKERSASWNAFPDWR